MSKRTFLFPLVVTSILVSGCSWFTPLSRALRQLSSARSVRIECTRTRGWEVVERVFTLDGNKVSIQVGSDTTIMEIDYWKDDIDVYTKDESRHWQMTTVTFEEINFDEDAADMTFVIPGSWVEADPTDEMKFWIIEEQYDQFADFTDIALLNDSYGPSIASIAFYITEDAEFDQFEVTINTWYGDYILTLEFSRFNAISVSIPKLD